MTKIVWMSDLHFARDGEVFGHDPRLRLRAAVQHINAHHDDAEICVLSGDLVNHGTAADYEALRPELDALAIPYAPMVGNHDTRGLLRQSLPLPESAMAEFVQYPIETPDALILCLDTVQAGSAGGEFCAARADWLRSALADAGDRPVLLFLHHPPMPLGLPMQDADRMADGASFLDLIADCPAVAYLFIGHVHRPISGTVRGIPYSTMRSVLLQAPAPRPAWDWTTFKPAAEAPNIGIIAMDDGDVTLQFEQFCGTELGSNTA